MRIEKFEQITAWQKSRDLNIIIYKTFNSCKDFSSDISKMLSGFIKTL